MKSTIKKIISVLIGLVIALALSLPYLYFRQQIQDAEAMGYLGLVLSCAISSISILIPTSSTLIVLAAASVLNPWLCAILGGLGVAVGEQASYICGRIGTIGFQKSGVREQKLVRWLYRNEGVTVFLFALIPLPVFDLVGIAAGALRMPWLRYSIAAVAGKIARFLILLLILKYILPSYVQLIPGEVGVQIRQIIALYS